MLLTTAALLCKNKLVIGITSDEMILKKANINLLQPYLFREEIVKKSLINIGTICEIQPHMLNDSIGKAGTKELNALVLTKETLKGGHMVNNKRKENNLPEVPLILANLLPSSSKDDKISSTFIRNNILSEINTEKLELLYSLWHKLLFHSLSLDLVIISKWFSIIRDLYMQSWRKYHTLTHIYHFITLAVNYISDKKIKDKINPLLAIWFHDVIYTPTRLDNEERSVELFKQFYEDIKRQLVLSNTLCLIDVDKVSFYIMCTKNHFKEIEYEDNDLNYLLDFDLYTLGLDDFEKYYEINKKVEYEYRHHLTDDEWRLGRVKFLKTVLEKKFIYRSKETREKLEDNCRINITKEIEILSNK